MKSRKYALTIQIDVPQKKQQIAGEGLTVVNRKFLNKPVAFFKKICYNIIRKKREISYFTIPTKKK